MPIALNINRSTGEVWPYAHIILVNNVLNISSMKQTYFCEHFNNDTDNISS